MELSIFGIISYSNEKREEADVIVGRVVATYSTVFWFSVLVMAFIGITLQGINRTLGLPELAETKVFKSPVAWFAISACLLLMLGATLFREYSLEFFRDYMRIRKAEVNEHEESLPFTLQLIADLMAGLILGLVLGLSAFFISMFAALPISLFLFLIFSGLRLPYLTINFILSSVVAWGIGFILPYKIWKRYVEQSPPENSPQEFYGLSQRAKEILKSELPPILCESCGSFNAAERKVCIVCGEKFIQESQSET